MSELRNYRIHRPKLANVWRPALLSCSKNWIDLYLKKVLKYIKWNWEIRFSNSFLPFLFRFCVFRRDKHNILRNYKSFFVEIQWLLDTNLFDRTGTWENERNSWEKIFLQFYISLQQPQSLLTKSHCVFCKQCRFSNQRI